MTPPARGRLRRLWFNVHLWIGVGLAALLIPLGLTGSVLVWSDAIEAAAPGHAITGPPAATLPPSAYLAAGRGALGPGARIVALRRPERAGAPVVVQATREDRNTAGAGGAGAGGAGGRPRRPPRLSVYLNPADARVLSSAEGRPGWWTAVHGFHEQLLSPGWGRAAVGWLGVAMLVSSLTGIWLWWPRAGPLVKGLRFRRTAGFWLNLHHTAGFWISLPLAFVSLTGVGLGFPQQTRAIIGLFAPVSAQGPGTGPGPGGPVGAQGPATAQADSGRGRDPGRGHKGGPGGGHGGHGRHGGGDHGRGGEGASPAPRLDPDAVLAAAHVAPADWRVLTLPTRRTPAWTVERASGPALRVADADGAVGRAPAPPGGDVAWRWVHRLHGGDGLPLAWRLVVTLCGLAPTLLGATGIAVWASRLRRRRALAAA